MKPLRISAALIFTALACLAVTGCRTVDAGPSLPPTPGGQGEIRGVEPQPAPIPTKDVSSGATGLSHTKPDQRIDK